MSRPGAWRRALRVRVTATFALGGFGLSLVLATLTYVLADRNLTDQRETSATRQTYLYARLVRDGLHRGAAEAEALASLEVPADRTAVLHRASGWFSTEGEATSSGVPGQIRAALERGVPVHQRIDIDDRPTLVVALPVEEIGGEFVMLFSLAELDDTLTVLRTILIAVAGATTVAAAVVGAWASRRVLRPLASVGAAARTIAAGDLQARLETGEDPDLAELSESFNAMVRALERRIERDARFASDVSHELRSPLTTLVSALSVLERRRDELSGRAQEALDLLSAEVERFERLLQELLELSRAESGSDLLQLEPVNLAALVRRTVAARDGDTRVAVEPGADGLDVLVDPRRLDRVLTNLLENAKTHGGGATLVTVRRADHSVRIEVDDRGPGVAAEQREEVFERFFRGPASGRRGDAPGTGLGLALVAEHVRLMGGRTWVEDAPNGVGARFIVELPGPTT